MVTSGESEMGRGKWGKTLKGTNYYVYYKINKLHGCIVQHREYSQYFIIIINGV